MTKVINSGDCVKIPDGRIARVRNISQNEYRVRVRRKESNFSNSTKENLPRFNAQEVG